MTRPPVGPQRLPGDRAADDTASSWALQILGTDVIMRVMDHNLEDNFGHPLGATRAGDLPSCYWFAGRIDAPALAPIRGTASVFVRFVRRSRVNPSRILTYSGWLHRTINPGLGHPVYLFLSDTEGLLGVSVPADTTVRFDADGTR